MYKVRVWPRDHVFDVLLIERLLGHVPRNYRPDLDARVREFLFVGGRCFLRFAITGIEKFEMTSICESSYG